MIKSQILLILLWFGFQLGVRGEKKTSISDGNTKEKNFKGGWFEKECQVEKEAGSKSVSPF